MSEYESKRQAKPDELTQYGPEQTTKVMIALGTIAYNADLMHYNAQKLCPYDDKRVLRLLLGFLHLFISTKKISHYRYILKVQYVFRNLHFKYFSQVNDQQH